jgi:hypothetical protein
MEKKDLLRNKDLDCVASRCVADGTEKVGYMYRDEQGVDDSGWRFFSGNEPGWYFMEPDNLPIVSIEEIVKLNPDVGELLTAPQGSFFRRDENGVLVPTDPPEKSSIEKLMDMEAEKRRSSFPFTKLLIMIAAAGLIVYFILRWLMGR